MIRNLVEEHVQTSYDALRGNFPAFCGCEYCRDDIFVFALNRVPPRYVALGHLHEGNDDHSGRPPCLRAW